jgi:hypothetical protein
MNMGKNDKYAPARGRGSKTVIGAMGDGAKGKLVIRNGKVVKTEDSTVDTSKGTGKHRKGDPETGR